ncbi:MAG: tripartite tricarboxylate transporter substrate binding protein [Betaproteobacteria bacterium]|nr:tripartite tricarboxylate transporter substrate binding protein [Betaproteobacteria bacterium]
MKLLYRVTVTILALAIYSPAPAVAQAYPDKPVRVIVVFPPGGSNDVVARIVFQKVSEMLGQQFVIENRGGAAGTIGSEVVAGSAADGYTIMVQSATHVANPHLYKKLPYDALKDFVGVTTLARQVGMLVVHPSLPAKSVKEFIALARTRPGEINYASAGNGSFVHLTMALFASVTNTRMVHVPYRGGGPAGTALIAGETQAMIATIGSLFPHIKSKRVRPLGVTSDKRTAQFPDVPAIAETVPGYEFTAWVGCFAPAGTPRAIVDRLNTELKKALADPGVASKLTVQTLDPMHMTPEQFAARLKLDYDKYEKVIKLSGAKIG